MYFIATVVLVFALASVLTFTSLPVGRKYEKSSKLNAVVLALSVLICITSCLTVSTVQLAKPFC